MTHHTHPVVGLLGRAGAGKDTVAWTLINDHGYTRVAFGDPIKRAALALDPIIVAYCDEQHIVSRAPEVARLSWYVDEFSWDEAKRLREVRGVLQRLGTEVGRELFGPDVWLNLALADVRATPGPVVLTDVRFPNEAEAVRSLGGTLVRVVRTDQAPATDPHASETLMADWPVDHEVCAPSGDFNSLAREAHLVAAIEGQLASLSSY